VNPECLNVQCIQAVRKAEPSLKAGAGIAEVSRQAGGHVGGQAGRWEDRQASMLPCADQAQECEGSPAPHPVRCTACMLAAHPSLPVSKKTVNTSLSVTIRQQS